MQANGCFKGKYLWEIFLLPDGAIHDHFNRRSRRLPAAGRCLHPDRLCDHVCHPGDWSCRAGGFAGPDLGSTDRHGDNTIWAPVVLHVATHMLHLVDISEPQYLIAVAVWLVLQIGMVFLVYLFLNHLIRKEPKNETR